MRKTIRRLTALLFFLLLLSCTPKNGWRQTTKYRDKNEIEQVVISLKSGRLNILGWKESFIDIITEKILHSKFPSDLSLIKTEIHNDEWKKTLYIQVTIPESVDAEANLTVYLPFTLKMITVDSINIDFHFSNTFSNLIYTSQSGNCYVDFKGSLAKITKESGNTIIHINTTNSVDILLNNDNGNSKIQLQQTGENSFLNAVSVSGNINIEIGKENTYTLTSKTQLPHILKLNNEENLLLSDEKNLLIKTEVNPKIQIFLQNQTGKTSILEEKREQPTLFTQ